MAQPHSAVALDRVLLGSPLRQRRYAIIIAALLLVVLLLAIIGLASYFSHLKPQTDLLFLTALGASGVASLMSLTILSFLDRRERESRWLFVIAFLWGAVIATGLALPVNTAALRAIARLVSSDPSLNELVGGNVLIVAAPIAGPVEETAKGLGVLLLFVLLRAEFDNMRDGMIYGALVGAGFNWFETATYIVSGYISFGVPPWAIQFGGRYALFGLDGHVLYTAMFGAMLGLARQTTRRWVRWVAPFVGLALAITAHSFNNALGFILLLIQRTLGQTPADPNAAPPTDISFLTWWSGVSLFHLVIFAPFFLLMIIVTWRSGVWEIRTIREQLADEIGDAVTPEEYEQITHDRWFRTRRIQGINRRRSRALVNAQNELAFRKWRVKSDGGDVANDVLVLGWRRQITRLRGE